MAKEPVDVTSIISAVCDVFRPQARAQNVTVQSNVTHADKRIKDIPFLYGDKRRFKQILMNLIKNALKFTTKGKIEIKAVYNDQLISSPEL